MFKRVSNASPGQDKLFLFLPVLCRTSAGITQANGSTINQNPKPSFREKTVFVCHPCYSCFVHLLILRTEQLLLLLSCQVRKSYYVHPSSQNKLLFLLSSTLTWMSNGRQASAVYFSSTKISGSKSTYSSHCLSHM